MRIAAVDVGSNSIHMVVAQVEADGRFRVLDRAKEMVRLGRKTLSNGRLSAQAIDAGVKTLAAFRTLAERQGVTRITAVNTAKDGKNTFRVEARLDGEPGRLRPGMEGVGKVRIDERRLVWIWSHTLTEWVQLWLWSWMP